MQLALQTVFGFFTCGEASRSIRAKKNEVEGETILVDPDPERSNKFPILFRQSPNSGPYSLETLSLTILSSYMMSSDYQVVPSARYVNDFDH